MGNHVKMRDTEREREAKSVCQPRSLRQSVSPTVALIIVIDPEINIVASLSLVPC